MSGVAAIVGGVIAAGGAIAAGAMSSHATTSAANTAAGVQEQALQQQAALAQPYTQLGQSAIGQYQALLGLTGPNGQGGPGNANTLAALQATPGYQFTQQQGDQATLNSAAASGLLLSGNTLQGLDQFNTGLADQTYQQAVTNAQNAVGIGQAAAAGQAANIGGAASNLSNLAVNQGNTLASIDENTIAGITGAIGNATNNYTIGKTLAGLENPAVSSIPGGTLETANDGYTENIPVNY